jgi:hypothetical protein
MLDRVTITGADDTTDIETMLNLSREYPFLEWGILVSRKAEGRGRFPSRTWIDELVAAVATRPEVELSTHVCGAWVRAMFMGELDWSQLPTVIGKSNRIQINTHAEIHQSTTAMWTSLAQHPTKQYVFQWDGVNDHLTYAAKAMPCKGGIGIKVAVLFDTSGGAGILPESWPEPLNGIYCGYAGGLGPDNVAENISKIEKLYANPFRHSIAPARTFWIDMERRVRTNDDSRLDMDAVRRVLEQSAKFMGG